MTRALGDGSMIGARDMTSIDRFGGPFAASGGASRVSKDVALAVLHQYRERLGNEPGSCTLCAVCERDAADVIFQTPLAQVRLDRFGCTDAHLMVVPLEHVEHGTELSWERYAHLQWLAHQASAVLQREFAPRRVFVASLGASKPLAQSFPHFHVHVIPVYHDDERARPAHVLSWSSGVTIYSDEQASHLVARLRRAFTATVSEGTVMVNTTIGSRGESLDEVSGTAPGSSRLRLTATVRRLAAPVLSLFAASACASAADSDGPEVIEPLPPQVQPSQAQPQLPSVGEVPADVIPLPQATPIPGLESHPVLSIATDDNPAHPIVTGTLLITSDGTHAFASDVDRDAVFRVELASRTVTRVATEAGDIPGQLVEAVDADGNPLVLAALRDAGALLAIDPVSGETQRIDVCAAPRGLAYDAITKKTYVACQTGELQTLDAATGVVERSINVATDLRDVQVYGDGLVVSRYRSAEVLTVDANGAVTERSKPDVMPDCAEPAIMHRMVVHGNSVYLAHQSDTEGTLGTFPGGYGSAGDCPGGTIEPVVVVANGLSQLSASAGDVTHVNWALDPTSQTEVDGEVFSVSAERPTFGLLRRTGPLDLAVSATGRIAVTFSGDSLWPETDSIVTLEPVEGGFQYRGYRAVGTVTAVAFDSAGSWIVQSREPAMLNFEDGSYLALDKVSAANTGLDLFYVNTGEGLSCAGCHPEGDEDGRTWVFPQGLRRTQTLTGGVMGRAPFHWDGEMPEMNTLVREVMQGRMAFHTEVGSGQVQILGNWLDRIPAAPPVIGADDLDLDSEAAATVERGRVLFNDEIVGCGTCHSGVEYTDNKSYDVGTGGHYYTPTLIGIGLRDSFMHDGCAHTLEQRFGLCGGGDSHGKTSHLDDAQLAELAAFMRTL